MRSSLLKLGLLTTSLAVPLLRAQFDSLNVRVDSSEARLQPSTPWTSYTFSRQQITASPYRSTGEFLSLLPGIATVNGIAYGRGSRSYELGYSFDGINTTNPFTSTNTVTFIPEATEELTVHTGAFGASLGSWNGGLVAARMREGGSVLEFSVKALSDDLAGPGKTFLNTSSYGFKSIVATAGGPVSPDVRFFLAGEIHAMRDRRPSFIEPFRFDSLVTDNLGSGRVAGTPLPGPVEFVRNHVPGFQTDRWTVQGNIAGNFSGIDAKLSGSYSSQHAPVAGGGGSPLFESNGNSWASVLQNYFALARAPINETKTAWISLQGRFAPAEFLSVSASVSYQQSSTRTYDPDFGDNWRDYPDSAANFSKYGIDPTDGTPTWRNRYTGPYGYSTIYSFFFYHPYAPNNSYSKGVSSGWDFNGDMRLAVNDVWTIHAGADHSTWVYRTFSVGNILGYRTYLDPDRDGVDETTFTDEEDRRLRLKNAAFVQSIGYDVDGKETESGFDSPSTPSFTSVFIDNEYTANNVRLNFGVRYEAFDLKFPVAAYDTINGVYGPVSELRGGIPMIDESRLTHTTPRTELLPRISVEYNSAGGTFYFAAGKYAEMLSLSRLYLPANQLNAKINPGLRVPYWLGGSLAGHRMEPERSVHFESGGTLQLSSQLSLHGAAYYKILSHQSQLGYVYDQFHPTHATQPYVTLLNEGEGSVRGFQVGAEVAPTAGVRMSLAYAYTNAKGLTSLPTSNWATVTDQPLQPSDEYIPFDYQINHTFSGKFSALTGQTGSLLFDDWTLSGLVLFSSGHPFTNLKNLDGFGGGTAWNVGTRSLSDVRSQVPIAGYNQGQTPSTLTVDMTLLRSFSISGLRLVARVDVLNLINKKNVLNVYPQTGSPSSDGWLASQYSESLHKFPLYDQFYNAINRANRWAYIGATGNDIYGSPRQIRFGLEVAFND